MGFHRVGILTNDTKCHQIEISSTEEHDWPVIESLVDPVFIPLVVTVSKQLLSISTATTTTILFFCQIKKRRLGFLLRIYRLSARLLGTVFAFLPWNFFTACLLPQLCPQYSVFLWLYLKGILKESCYHSNYLSTRKVLCVLILIALQTLINLKKKTRKPNGHFNRPFWPSPPLGFTNRTGVTNRRDEKCDCVTQYFDYSVTGWCKWLSSDDSACLSYRFYFRWKTQIHSNVECRYKFAHNWGCLQRDDEIFAVVPRPGIQTVNTTAESKYNAWWARARADRTLQSLGHVNPILPGLSLSFWAWGAQPPPHRSRKLLKLLRWNLARL